MGNVATIEYRIPVPISQDEEVQDLVRQLAKERGQRRFSIRQFVREAIGASIESYRVRTDTTGRSEPVVLVDPASPGGVLGEPSSPSIRE